MAEGRGLYEVAREKMRTRHFAFRTEQAYLHWIRRYVNFHNRKHPREIGSADVEAFLSHLAVDGHVSASTQNQALQALLFLYRHVLEIGLHWLENVTRARRSKRLSSTELRGYSRAGTQSGRAGRFAPLRTRAKISEPRDAVGLATSVRFRNCWVILTFEPR
jgi:hypothetical protein